MSQTSRVSWAKILQTHYSELVLFAGKTQQGSECLVQASGPRQVAEPRPQRAGSLQKHPPSFPQPTPSPTQSQGAVTGLPENEAPERRWQCRNLGSRMVCLSPAFPAALLSFNRLSYATVVGGGLEASTPLWIVLGAPSLLLILQSALLILDPVDSG